MGIIRWIKATCCPCFKTKNKVDVEFKLKNSDTNANNNLNNEEQVTICTAGINRIQIPEPDYTISTVQAPARVHNSRSSHVSLLDVARTLYDDTNDVGYNTFEGAESGSSYSPCYASLNTHHHSANE